VLMESAQMSSGEAKRRQDVFLQHRPFREQVALAQSRVLQRYRQSYATLPVHAPLFVLQDAGQGTGMLFCLQHAKSLH
jgi:hypothetical protein